MLLIPDCLNQKGINISAFTSTSIDNKNLFKMMYQTI